MVALGVAQQTAENFNEEKQAPEIGSFLFSKKAQEVFGKAQGGNRENLCPDKTIAELWSV